MVRESSISDICLILSHSGAVLNMISGSGWTKDDFYGHEAAHNVL